jgi:capsular polysaccharide biosynthesis protein
VLPNGFVLVNKRLLPEAFLGVPRGLRALRAALRVRQYHMLTRKVPVERALFLTDEFSNGFFHWVGDVLPKLEALGSQEASERTLVVPAMADFEYARQSLAPYGLNKVQFLGWSDRAVCRELALVLPVAPTGNFRPLVMSALRSRMRKYFRAGPAQKGLYISRAGSAGRRIVNESEVLPVLQRFGFERVLTERLSFSEQVRLVGSASIVIGNHGAGLTHACWMLPGTNLFELRRQGDQANNCYFSLAAALGMRYHYLTCKTENDRSATHTADILVDIPRLETELVSLIEGEERERAHR